MLNEEAFLYNESAMNRLTELLADPVMQMAMTYLRTKAPRSPIHSPCSEQWQQTRYDGVVAGWDAVLLELELLPDTMGQAMVARNAAANEEVRREFAQHADLPDHTDV